MLTLRGEGAPARTGTPSTPKCQPGTSAKKSKAIRHSRRIGRRSNVPRTFNERAPRLTASDAVVWAVYFALTAAVILALCILVTLGWPS